MKRTILIAGLALMGTAPLAAQEAPRHYRYRIEAPYREYGRMGREYARLYSRDWARRWSRNDFGRSFQRHSRDMGRNWSRMGREFRSRDYGRMGRDYGRMGREFGRMGREHGRMGRDMMRDDMRFRVRHHPRSGDI